LRTQAINDVGKKHKASIVTVLDAVHISEIEVHRRCIEGQMKYNTYLRYVNVRIDLLSHIIVGVDS